MNLKKAVFFALAMSGAAVAAAAPTVSYQTATNIAAKVASDAVSGAYTNLAAEIAAVRASVGEVETKVTDVEAQISVVTTNAVPAAAAPDMLFTECDEWWYENDMHGRRIFDWDPDDHCWRWTGEYGPYEPRLKISYHEPKWKLTIIVPLHGYIETTSAAPRDVELLDFEYTEPLGAGVLTNRYSFVRHVYQYATNTVKGVVGEVGKTEVEIPAAAAERGVTFVHSSGEDQNAAVEIGRAAKAAVTQEALLAAPSNAVARSTGVAIGAGAVATDDSKPYSVQGVAVGWRAQSRASNAIAIGGGAQHPNETVETGNATVASGSTSVAIGYDAKATAAGAVAFGRSAKARADGAVQLGTGANTGTNSLQFREWRLLDGRGQIPAERLADAAEAMTGGMLSQLERLVSPGNMAVMYGGDDDQRIEPRLDGVCDVEMSKGTNEVFMAGAEVYIEPPLGSRNYDLVFTNIPQAYRWETVEGERSLVPVPEDHNFSFDFSELPQGITPTLRCAASIGYVRGVSIVITNAPLVVRMRQPATNRVVAVAKPWDEMEL